ncbi:creatininase family protein, partial [Candidatus Aerophobetes bacterium]|nr:creatininase family protein [Candidatus Aerophobetes bacterium]
RSLIWHGFNKVVFATGHTSNLPTLDYTIRALRYHTGALVFAYGADTESFAELNKDVIEDKEGLAGWHAAEIETSGALLFCPELVKKERMEKQLPSKPEYLPENMEKKDGSGFRAKYRGLEIRFPFQQNEYAKTGVMGDPKLASREKGEIIYSRMIKLFADFLKELKKVKVDWEIKRDFPDMF